MTNLFINNIDEKMFPIEGGVFKDKINSLIRKVKVDKIDTIYYVSNEPIFSDKWKIITDIDNIKILISDNFPYILRHLAASGRITKNSFILSNNLWELYLSFFVNVYVYKNNALKKVNQKYLEKMFDLKLEELNYLNDYIFLQEKNPEDSLGKKKTITLLREYEGLENLYIQRDKIDNIRSKELINYQAQKIKFYIETLKPMFLEAYQIKDE